MNNTNNENNVNGHSKNCKKNEENEHLLERYKNYISERDSKHFKSFSEDEQESVIREAEDLILSKNIENIVKSSSTADVMFLSIISHEMRTPLNGIVGVTDLMTHEEKSGISDNLKLYIQTLEQSCRTLLTVMNRLQDLSDLQFVQNNEVQEDCISLDIRAIIEGISENLSYFDENIDIKTHLFIEVDERIPQMMKGNLTRIQQVFTNIVSIAALVGFDKYAKIIVTLSYAYDKEILIKVLIQSSTIANKQFFNLKNFSTIYFEKSEIFDSKSYSNMEIGVNICRKFVQMLGSNLNTTITDDDKLQFSLLLPLIVADNEDVNLKKSFNNIRKIENVNILIVDDNAVNRMIIQKMLHNIKVKTEIAVDGKKALDEIKNNKHKYDLVLMDLDMPIMDGYESTKCIRSKLKDDVTIIALTADSTNNAKRKCKEVGMNDYFTKPLTTQTLKNMIAKWI